MSFYSLLLACHVGLLSLGIVLYGNSKPPSEVSAFSRMIKPLHSWCEGATRELIVVAPISIFLLGVVAFVTGVISNILSLRAKEEPLKKRATLSWVVGLGICVGMIWFLLGAFSGIASMR